MATNRPLNTLLTAPGTAANGTAAVMYLQELIDPTIKKQNIIQKNIKTCLPGVNHTFTLKPLLESVQKEVNKRIECFHISKCTVEPRPPIIDWPEEANRIKALFEPLKKEGSNWYKICDTLFQDTIQTCQELRKTVDKTPQIHDQLVEASRTIEEKIGKILFLSERCPKLATDSKVWSKEKNKLKGGGWEYLEKQYEEKLQEAFQAFKFSYDHESDYPLQEPGLIKATEMPKYIAQLLLTKYGQLNLGIIDTIKKKFLSKNDQESQIMVQILDSLDPSWQARLEQVEVPLDDNLNSEEMIRADLKLSSTEPITRLHCQQAALGALLDQCNESPINKCYSIARGIRKVSTHLINSFEDYISLIKNGYLTRLVDNKEEKFFFPLTIAKIQGNNKGGIDSSIKLDRQGGTYAIKGPRGEIGTKHSFYAFPHLVASWRGIGGPGELADQKKAVVQSLFNKIPKEIKKAEFTWADLTRELAVIAADAGENKDFNSKLTIALYRFPQDKNRLQSSYEAALAAFGQGRKDDYIRNKINTKVMNVLNGIFEQSKQLPSESQQVVEKLKRTFQKVFNDRFHFIYNPELKGFELHKKENMINRSTQIITPSDFSSFVQHSLTEAQNKEISLTQSIREKGVIQYMTGALTDYTKTKEFMYKILIEYDRDNELTPNPVEDYEKLLRTPMRYLQGEAALENFTVESGKDFIPHVDSIYSHNPRDLLKWILDVHTWKESTTKYFVTPPPVELYAETPRELLERISGIPELIEFATSKETAETWINKKIIQPGLKISLDGTMKEKLQKGLEIFLQQRCEASNIVFPKERLDHFFKELNAKSSLKLQEYSEQLIDGLALLFELTEQHKYTIAFTLDVMLCSMPIPAYQKLLIGTAIRFAKVNWDGVSAEDDNTYYCCYFHPRTGTVGLGKIDASKEGLIDPVDLFTWQDTQPLLKPNNSKK